MQTARTTIYSCARPMNVSLAAFKATLVGLYKLRDRVGCTHEREALMQISGPVEHAKSNTRFWFRYVSFRFHFIPVAIV